MRKSDLSRQKPGRLRDKLKANNALTRAISAVSLTLIVAGLFAFVLVGLNSLNLLVIPDFLQGIFTYGRDDGEPERPDDSSIYDFLRPERAAQPGGFSAEISLEHIRGIISVINLPDNLHLETTARYYMDGVLARTVEMSLWRKGDKHKYILSAGGEPEQIYINNGVAELIANNITGSSVRRSAAANFSFENVPHISDINYYLSLIESGEVIYYEIKRDTEGNILVLTYIIEEFDQREYINISLETGIVLSVRTEVGGVLFYASGTSVVEAYFTGDAPESTGISASLFAIG